MTMPEPEERRAEVAERPALTRAQARQVAAIFVVVSLSVAIVLFDLAGGLRHGAGRPASITLVLTGGWCLASSFLTWVAFAPVGSTYRRDPTLLAATAAATPGALVIWTSVFHDTYAEPFEGAVAQCLGLTLVIAAIPLFGFMLLRRGASPASPGALGATAGAMCGAWATVIVDVWCPLTSSAHTLLGHATPLALLAALGAVVGARVLARPSS